MISFAHCHYHTHTHSQHSPHRVTSTTHQIRPADLSTESESHSPSPSHRSTSLPDAWSRPSVLRESQSATTTIHECTPPRTTTHDDGRRTPFSPRTTTHNQSFRLHQSPATQPSPVLLLQPAAPHQSSLSLSLSPVCRCCSVS